MNKLFAAAVIAAMPLTAVVAQAPMPAKTYVMKAGASDQYEIQSSNLLLQTTQNAKLKEFANMMVTDHTKSTADVKAAATASGMTVAPPKLDAKGASDVAALRKAKGTARDTLYVTQQKASHQKALALQQGYAANGTDAGLKSVASNIVPVVQKHIAELQAM